MKLYVLSPNENWICDRMVDEWKKYNSDITIDNPNEADVIWLLADWCFKHLPYNLLKHKKVVTTIHHIVPEKFNDIEKKDFLLRDQITDLYHCYNDKTINFLKKITNKPIMFVPYWANQNIWKKSFLNKEQLRQKYNIPIDSFLCGSFQRDTEGGQINSGIFLPKLEKGPDLFCDYIEYLNKTNDNLHVLLSGWRRQYVVKRLKDGKIPFTYIELPQQNVLNELYQTLDLYPISSRCEGGPQALIECGLLDINVVSRDVGIASQLLPHESINDDLKKTSPSIPNVKHMMLPNGFYPYKKLFVEVLK